MLGRLYIMHCDACLMETGEVGLEVFCAFLSQFQYVHGGFRALSCKEACQGQAVAAIVALAAKYVELIGQEVVLLYPLKAADGRRFHEIDRADGLVTDGMLIPFVDLPGREN